MIEPIQINISNPFRLDGKAVDHPGCIRKFSALEIEAFLQALQKEIAAAGNGTEEYQVQEISFGTGSVAHLGIEAPKRILQMLRSAFQVIDAARITLRSTPSALDFFVINSIRQLGNSFLLIEIPTLEEKGLEEAGYVCSRTKALDALDSCFQNGFRNFSCELEPRYFQSLCGVEDTMLEILKRKPQGIAFASAPKEPYASLISELLGQKGYRKEENSDFWVRGAGEKHRLFRNQIGFGPYAVSVFDGRAVRATGDFAFYLEHSENFEALITHS